MAVVPIGIKVGVAGGLGLFRVYIPVLVTRDQLSPPKEDKITILSEN